MGTTLQVSSPALIQQPPVRVWFDAENIKVSGGDQSILDWIGQSPRNNQFGYPIELIVGTDSHSSGQFFRFPSVVCIYSPGRGGLYYYTVTKEPRALFKKNQQFRMFQEVAKSIELATWIEENSGWKPVIHIDASKKEAGHFTSAFSDSLKGYAIGSGFNALLKPESFCANSLSDRHSKH